MSWRERIWTFVHGLVFYGCVHGYWQDRHGSLEAYVAHLHTNNWNQIPDSQWATSAAMALIAAFVLPTIPQGWARRFVR